MADDYSVEREELIDLLMELGQGDLSALVLASQQQELVAPLEKLAPAAVAKIESRSVRNRA
jgi:hypothetical protein